MRHERSPRTSDSARPSSRRRIVSSLFVLALFLVPVFLPGSASADAVSDKRTQAQQIAAKLDQLDQKLSSLDEQYNGATIGLDKANGDVAAAQKAVDETNAQIDASARDLQQFAVQAYMTGNDTQALDAILTSDAEQASQKRSYLEAAHRNKQDLIDKLSADKAKADVEIEKLNAAKAKAQGQADAIKSAKDQATAALAEQQSLNAQVQGELKDLVDQARAAQAAAQAAEAARSDRLRPGRGPRHQAGVDPVQPHHPQGPQRPVDPASEWRWLGHARRLGRHRRGHEQARCAVRVGRRRTERLRLLRPGDVGLGAGRSQPAALVGCHVVEHAARLALVAPAGRPHLLRQPGAPRRPLHRWRQHRARPACRQLRPGRQHQLLERHRRRRPPLAPGARHLGPTMRRPR